MPKGKEKRLNQAEAAIGAGQPELVELRIAFFESVVTDDGTRVDREVPDVPEERYTGGFFQHPGDPGTMMRIAGPSEFWERGRSENPMPVKEKND